MTLTLKSKKSNSTLLSLFDAIERGEEAVLASLIARGFPLEERDRHGQTLAMKAASEAMPNCLNQLITAGANLEATDNQGQTPLLHVMHFGEVYDQEKCISLLIKAGANINARDHDASSAVFNAVAVSNHAALRLLIDAGADVDASSVILSQHSYDWTPLMFACLRGDDISARMLIEANADLDAKNDKGLTACMVAAREGEASCLLPLVSAGANLWALDDDEASAYNHAKLAEKHEIAEMIFAIQEAQELGRSTPTKSIGSSSSSPRL